MAILGIALAVVGLISITTHLVRRRRQEHRFIWRTGSISASILRYNGHILAGQYLNLDQELLPGESGWINMKIDLPESWVVQSTIVGDTNVVIRLATGDTYRVDQRNAGLLSFEILDGGPGKAGEILEKIWNKHARIESI